MKKFIIAMLTVMSILMLTACTAKLMPVETGVTMFRLGTTAMVNSITYIVDGEEAEGFLPNPTTYDVDDITILNPTPQADNWLIGYRFSGWYLDGQLVEGTINPSELGWSGNIILSGNYILNNYPIYYELNGGVNAKGNPATYTYLDGDVRFLPATRPGYVFKGWFYDEEFTDVAESILSGSCGEFIVYAKWELSSTYSIIYELNGGTNSPANPDTYSYYDEDILLEDAVREGYTFLGWHSEPDFVEDSRIYEIASGSRGVFILYARWEEVC